MALARAGRMTEALAAFDEAQRIAPRDAALHVHRGLVLKELGRFEDAAAAFGRAAELQPGLVAATANRGSALLVLRRFEEALGCFEQVLRVDPGSVEALNNRGSALFELRRFEESLASHEAALALRPGHASAFNNRGNALRELDRLDEALTSFEAALRAQPDFAAAQANRAGVLLALGRVDEALVGFDAALALRPDYPDARWGKAVTLLTIGRFAEGWRLHEARWQQRHAPPMRVMRADPPWLGEEALTGRSILLHAEQGLGDTLQFSPYAALLRDQGARVTLSVPPPLRTLLARSLPGVAVVDGDAPLAHHDRHCPLMSLPLALGARAPEPLAPAQRLRPDPERVARWASWLGPRSRPRVGLVWRGNPAHRNDRRRSLPLSALRHALPEGLEYLSLQKQLLDEEVPMLAAAAVRDPAALLEDFDDTAALCQCLDLVVSVDTSVAHLAAGLGRPTWILLPFAPDWRWMLERDDSPWYASVRLLRQGPDRGWGSVLARLARELAALPRDQGGWGPR
jgi:tetratricopeptide (TPR) repeat protein